jgi:hypothetical protein
VTTTFKAVFADVIESLTAHRLLHPLLLAVSFYYLAKLLPFLRAARVLCMLLRFYRHQSPIVRLHWRVLLLVATLALWWRGLNVRVGRQQIFAVEVALSRAVCEGGAVGATILFFLACFLLRRILFHLGFHDLLLDEPRLRHGLALNPVPVSAPLPFQKILSSALLTFAHPCEVLQRVLALDVAPLVPHVKWLTLLCRLPPFLHLLVHLAQVLAGAFIVGLKFTAASPLMVCTSQNLWEVIFVQEIFHCSKHLLECLWACQIMRIVDVLAVVGELL